MQFVKDPSISVKINEMKQRVRWQESAIKERAIDQTKLLIKDSNSNNPDFSFLVIGDSGCGQHYDHHPQRQIAELMLKQSANFILHTGDVVYQVGSKEYYYKNFIKPYKEYLVGGESPKKIAYDELIFKLPFLPVPGNHDYYDLPLLYGVLSQLTWGVRHLLPITFDFDVGWHGSFKGQAYSKAFLDYLADIKSPHLLAKHLDKHYDVNSDGNRCLSYQPGHFTRLPNRYYTFSYGGIDFFALDSNTFNAPSPLPDTKTGELMRHSLVKRRKELETRKEKILTEIQSLNPQKIEEAELLDDKQGQINQIEEEQLDIDKRLDKHQFTIDFEQLHWLRDQLIKSWQNPEIRGRIIYLHHPPYVTEKTKWNQGQTLAVRHRLRYVFNEVAQTLGNIPQGSGIVDLVLSGHAHCLEHLYTENTQQADSFIHWLVCGGSGHSLRRQRSEGSILNETDEQGLQHQVARSLKFIGRNGHGSHKRRPYSFLKIEIKSGKPPTYLIHYHIAELYQHQWHHYQLEPKIIPILKSY
ncbi:hypothetical protein cce_4731 [Crocosphaera subtropica ATCC 51142]|uniref:Calcineurin-like phosphoesterase domain-containing protein n=1 Tax=Crocosphaera subtropica (strain ATCC 51142 / BH68) TaxID=43989 RepID=B1WWF1_CROS5|nr:hypothetical protein cce_4731 [Crocosphaera subtropica ATCC 51142]